MLIRFKRIWAALIDFYIACAVSVYLALIIQKGEPLVTTPLPVILFALTFSASWLLKDCVFKNASIGKRIFRLEVVKIDGTKPKLIHLLIREIPVFLLSWIEIIFLLANGRRVGDIWAKTLVQAEHRTGDGSGGDTNTNTGDGSVC